MTQAGRGSRGAACIERGPPPVRALLTAMETTFTMPMPTTAEQGAMSAERVDRQETVEIAPNAQSNGDINKAAAHVRHRPQLRAVPVHWRDDYDQPFEKSTGSSNALKRTLHTPQVEVAPRRWISAGPHGQTAQRADDSYSVCNNLQKNRVMPSFSRQFRRSDIQQLASHSAGTRSIFVP